jgi:hypothetical protein
VSSWAVASYGREDGASGLEYSLSECKTLIIQGQNEPCCLEKFIPHSSQTKGRGAAVAEVGGWAGCETGRGLSRMDENPVYT